MFAGCHEYYSVFMTLDLGWFIREAFKNYVDLCLWQAEQVRKGIADAEARRTLSHKQVKHRILKRAKAKM